MAVLPFAKVVARQSGLDPEFILLDHDLHLARDRRRNNRAETAHCSH